MLTWETAHPALARHLATKYHEGQVDKSGEPYINHPLWVAGHFGENGYLYAAAVLHDVLEDTEATSVSLLDAGIDNAVVEMVEALTRNKNKETYEQYIRRVAAFGPTARIKFWDLLHNLDPSRPGTQNLSRSHLERYHRALIHVATRIGV